MKIDWPLAVFYIFVAFMIGTVTGVLTERHSIPSNIEAFKCKDGSYHALVKQEDQSRNWVKLPVTCKGDE